MANREDKAADANANPTEEWRGAPLRSAFALDGRERKRQLFGTVGIAGAEQIFPRRPELFEAKCGVRRKRPGRKNASPAGEEFPPKSDGISVPAVSESGVRRKKVLRKI